MVATTHWNKYTIPRRIGDLPCRGAFRISDPAINPDPRGIVNVVVHGDLTDMCGGGPGMDAAEQTAWGERLRQYLLLNKLSSS